MYERGDEAAARREEAERAYDQAIADLKAAHTQTENARADLHAGRITEADYEQFQAARSSADRAVSAARARLRTLQPRQGGSGRARACDWPAS